MNVLQEKLRSPANRQSFALGVLTLSDYHAMLAIDGRARAQAQIRLICDLLEQHSCHVADDSLAFVLPYRAGQDLQVLGNALLARITSVRQMRSSESLPIPVHLILLAAHSPGHSPDSLIDRALVANQRAGQAAHSRLTLLDDAEQLDEKIEPLRREDRVRGALEADRLTLHSQRILPLDSIGSDCYHHEILVRLTDHDGALWMPDSFLPEAERLGLMPELDRRVVDRTYAWLANHRPGGNTPCRWTAINLSAHSLTETDLPAFIDARQREHRINPAEICFELTETSRIRDLPRAIAVMQRLREHGYRFALDDYGSGSATLSYLRDLPVDLVKIDGSFIIGLDQSPLNRDLVRELCRTCRRLGKQIVAEKVENMQVLDCVTGLGIDYAQGYAIEKPIPLNQLEPH